LAQALRLDGRGVAPENTQPAKPANASRLQATGLRVPHGKTSVAATMYFLIADPGVHAMWDRQRHL
jgi:hypothetical protein